MESDAPMSTTKKHATTDAEIDRAIRQGQAYDRTATKIDEARYDPQGDILVAHLSTGATLTIPRVAIPFLNALSPDAIGDPDIEPPGYALWFERPDIGVRLETLLEVGVGNLLRDIAARALGASKSLAKTTAVRANGRKGGRPRKKHAA
jgi:hypothetical protein